MGNSVKPLPKEAQLTLRNKARDELIRLQKLVTKTETNKMINDFKEKFMICEIVYKVILDDHQFNKTGAHPERMHITMRQVPHALNYAGYDFEKNLLTKLFGSENKIGKRSVKKLRDLLTHDLNPKVIDELTSRYDELNGYMDSFIKKISTYDCVA